jgi:ATP-dependent helicase/DNAse subunit B
MVRLGWFVRSEIEYFKKNPGLAPAHLEFSFGMNERRGSDPASTDEALVLTAGEVEICARGIIDRVDADAEGRATVIDYKTGNSVPTYSAVATGTSFQLFVYLLAAEALLGLQPEAGFYLKLSDAPGTKGSLTQSGGLACGEKPARGQQLKWPDLKTLLLRFLSAYAGDIAAGHFPLLPVSFDLKKEPCLYCDFQTLCRQDGTRLSGGRQQDSQRFARTRIRGEGDV